MGKNKSKKQTKQQQAYSEVSIKKQIKELYDCAKDLDKGVDVSSERMQVLLIAGTESIDRLQNELGRNARQSIDQKMRGYRFQLALTKEFVDEKAITLASTAKQLEYTMNYVSGSEFIA